MEADSMVGLVAGTLSAPLTPLKVLGRVIHMQRTGYGPLEAVQPCGRDQCHLTRLNTKKKKKQRPRANHPVYTVNQSLNPVGHFSQVVYLSTAVGLTRKAADSIFSPPTRPWQNFSPLPYTLE